MTTDEAEDILEEITRGGLPSNVKAEIVPELAAHAEVSPRAQSDAASAGAAEPSILEELAAVKVPERPKLCGKQFTQNGRAYPDFCSLPEGHPMRSATANHYAGTIGWFQ